jgi:deazaflavin-dependent oxidoreductase (nitroreductase family)
MSEMQDFNSQIAAEFRANEGQVGGMFAGATLLLLTTTGAKTGAARLNPLVYYGEGDRYVVFASAGGSPRHPDWYFNLTAHPEVTVEVGTETFRARATELVGEDRDRIYAAQAARSPQFAEYQQNTTRRIPAIALERI